MKSILLIICILLGYFSYSFGQNNVKYENIYNIQKQYRRIADVKKIRHLLCNKIKQDPMLRYNPFYWVLWATPATTLNIIPNFRVSMDAQNYTYEDDIAKYLTWDSRAYPYRADMYIMFWYYRTDTEQNYPFKLTKDSDGHKYLDALNIFKKEHPEFVFVVRGVAATHEWWYIKKNKLYIFSFKDLKSFDANEYLKIKGLQNTIRQESGASTVLPHITPN